MKVTKLHIILIGLILFTLTNSGLAQRYSNKGDRYFDLNLFEDAIHFYELEAKQGKDRDYKNYAKKQLAECYRILGEFEDAEKAYRKVLRNKKNRQDGENYLNYGKSLKSSAKFEEAKKQFEEFIKLKPDDPRGPMYLRSCDSAQKWLDANLGKTVKNLESINTTASEFSPVFIKDGKVVFTSAREGSKSALISFNGGMDKQFLDLYSFNFSDLANPDSVVIENIKSLNSPKHEGPATFTKDGKEVYFTMTVKGVRKKNTSEVINTLQVMYSKYDDSTQTWSEPVSAFSFNSEDYSVGHPSLSSDGNTIYFMSDMPGGYGGTDIYFCKKDENGKFTHPENAGIKVNTFGYELFPYISDDGTLYFSSNGHPGMGQLDIFYSVYKDGQWGLGVNMQPPINSIGDDFGITFDGKSKRGLFSSDRFNGLGEEDIYSFAEESPFELEVVENKIRFKNTKVFDGLKYTLKDTSGNAFDLLENNGYFEFRADTTIVYELTAKKSIFPINTYTISVNTSKKELTFTSNKLDFYLTVSLKGNSLVESKSFDNGKIEISESNNFIPLIPSGKKVKLKL